MKRKKKNNAGFTLVELMVVAVIVAILAAVAIPLMSANKNRAIMTEAEAALGSIRSVLRAQYAETGTYAEDINDTQLNSISIISDMVGVSAGDLNGRWWSEDCYEFVSVSTTSYVIKATGSLSDAPEAADVVDLWVTLDQDGSFERGDL